MGSCFTVNCNKCGCPRSYYQKDPKKSCHTHIFVENICRDCQTHFEKPSGNCYHRWKNYQLIL